MRALTEVPLSVQNRAGYHFMPAKGKFTKGHKKTGIGGDSIRQGRRGDFTEENNPFLQISSEEKQGEALKKGKRQKRLLGCTARKGAFQT